MPRPPKSPAFQWYPRDYLADALVQSMTLEQEGAYRRLMDVCWLEHGLPDDVNELWRLAKATSKERFTRVIWPLVGRKFQQRRGKLQHRRLDRERAKQAKTRHARKLAADERWERERCKSNANASRLQCLASSSASATAVLKEKPTAATAARSRKAKGSVNASPETGVEGHRMAAVVRGVSGLAPGGTVDAGQRVEGPDQGSARQVGFSIPDTGADCQGDGRDVSSLRTAARPPHPGRGEIAALAAADSGEAARAEPRGGAGSLRGSRPEVTGFVSLAALSARRESA